MRIFALLLCCLWHSTLHAEINERVVLRGAVKIHMPDELRPMSEWQMDQKYPGWQHGIEAFSLTNGTVSIAFHHTQNAIQETQIDDAHAVVSQLFRRRYGEARWIQSRVVRKFGTRVMVLEFVTQAEDTPIHNLMYGIPLKGRLLLVTFNATSQQVPEWLDRGRVLIDSIELVVDANGYRESTSP